LSLNGVGDELADGWSRNRTIATQSPAGPEAGARGHRRA
jgi:hypothetical protein